MSPMGLSGITHRFQWLSQTSRLITQALLSRSPLVYPRRGLTARLACLNHAANVRSEPGSNPSWNDSGNTVRVRRTAVLFLLMQGIFLLQGRPKAPQPARHRSRLQFSKTVLFAAIRHPVPASVSMYRRSRTSASSRARPKADFPRGHRRVHRPKTSEERGIIAVPPARQAFVRIAPKRSKKFFRPPCFAAEARNRKVPYSGSIRRFATFRDPAPRPRWKRGTGFSSLVSCRV